MIYQTRMRNQRSSIAQERLPLWQLRRAGIYRPVGRLQKALHAEQVVSSSLGLSMTRLLILREALECLDFNVSRVV